jgi:tRNA (adenine57-N1/adenine58-N1)-methyltransferase catalytic subunit
VSVELFTVQHRQLVVRRERIGYDEEGIRGGIVAPRTVEEALDRSREIEQNSIAYVQKRKEKNEQMKAQLEKDGVSGQEMPDFASDEDFGLAAETKADRVKRLSQESKLVKRYTKGRVVHRTEPELKTHTSFLLFAVLPPAWTDEDEASLISVDEK